MEKREIAKYLDDTLLKADATPEQIIAICTEAKKYGCASVCVNSSYVPLVAEQLKDSDVKTCCVVGFPLGACTSEAKAAETADSVSKGAQEIDMVIHIGQAKAGNWEYVQKDIEVVVKAANGACVKVIIETCLLTDEEKVKACQAAKAAGADFVKTSTGFSVAGAKVEDVRLMRQTVGNDMGVKAAGGVRDFDKAKAMIEAGANRIGTSSAAGILE